MAGTASERKSFLKFIAYLQVIGIILVVFGHSFHEYPDGSMGKTLLVYRMMYSFRMPLFMFVSGFLMVYTCFMDGHSSKWTSFAVSKIKRLLIPYFFLTLITFVPRASLSFMADDSITLSAESLFRALFYSGENMVIPLFWFLQASFLLLVITHLLISSAKKISVPDVVTYVFLIVLSLSLLVLPFEAGSFFSFSDVVRLAVYFMLGASYCRFHETIDRYIDWTSVFVLASSAVLWILLFFLTEGSQWSAVCSVFGIIMCVSVSKIMERRGITLLDPIIGANYMIFLLSWYFNVLSQQVLAYFTDMPWWCYTVVSLFSAIYFPLILYRFMKRNAGMKWVRLASLLLGQNIGRKSVGHAPQDERRFGTHVEKKVGC